jgi:hypothetical protein
MIGTHIHAYADDVMIGIVKSRLAEKDCKEKGWLLDGK